MPRTEAMPRRTAGPPWPHASGGASRPALAGADVGLEGGARPRGVEIRGADLDAVAAGVLHQGVRGVEAHGLGIEQPRAERRRVPPLQPRRRVDEVGEGHRVALGEPVVGEGRQLLPEQLDGGVVDPPGRGAVVEPLVQLLHPLAAALGPHGHPQLVGLGRGEATDVDGQLHELLLEQRHAQGLRQCLLGERVGVGDDLLAVAAPDVGVDRAALDGSGADQGDLHHQVVEACAA